jgi:hypothetical protein
MVVASLSPIQIRPRGHLEFCFPCPIPTAWVAVAWSDEFRPGDVRGLRAFDRELVLFRTQDGTAHVLETPVPTSARPWATTAIWPS